MAHTASTGRPVPVPSAAGAVVNRLRYGWHNGGHPVLRRVRTWWDCAGVRACPHVTSDGGPGAVRLGYAGVPEGVPNVLSLLEFHRDGPAPAARVTASRRLTRASLADLGGRVDLLLVAGSAGRVRRLPAAASLTLPLRVHLVVDVPGDLTTLRRAVSARERSWFQARRAEHGWRLTVRRDPAAFEFFYTRMHLPTMHARHGERARGERPGVARDAILARGAVFLVAGPDGPVAGALCRWDPATRTVTTRLLGVLGGDAGHYRRGAFKAVYHLLLEWAVEHGVRHVDLHGTEPFLSKGIVQFKRRLRPRVTLPPNHYAGKRLWLHACRDTPAVRRFLVDNPVLAVTADGGFEAVYFHDGRHPPRTDLGCGCPGVARTRLVDLDAFLPAARGAGADRC